MLAPPPSHRDGSGPPMVLLHGFTDTWQGWKRVLPLLEAHHDVFAPTLPGHLGGPPMEVSGALTLQRVTDTLEAMMDGAGMPRAHLVGSSLGGWLGLMLAARGRALSVVGVCPAGGWEPGGRDERRVVRFFRRNHLLTRFGMPAVPLVAASPLLRTLILRDIIGRPQTLSTAEARMLFEGAAGCSVVPQALDLVKVPGTFADPGPPSCRVRILYGTRDRLLRWPNHYTRMRRMLPDAEWVPLPGLSHLPMWDDPRCTVQRILEVSTAGAPTMPAPRPALSA